MQFGLSCTTRSSVTCTSHVSRLNTSIQYPTSVTIHAGTSALLTPSPPVRDLLVLPRHQRSQPLHLRLQPTPLFLAASVGWLRRQQFLPHALDALVVAFEVGL